MSRPPWRCGRPRRCGRVSRRDREPEDQPARLSSSNSTVSPAPGCLLEGRERRTLDLDPVVAQQQRAECLPDPECAFEVRGAEPDACGHADLVERLLERGRVGQLLDPVLEVDGVDEALHQPERPAGARPPGSFNMKTS